MQVYNPQAGKRLLQCYASLDRFQLIKEVTLWVSSDFSVLRLLRHWLLMNQVWTGYLYTCVYVLELTIITFWTILISVNKHIWGNHSVVSPLDLDLLNVLRPPFYIQSWLSWVDEDDWNDDDVGLKEFLHWCPCIGYWGDSPSWQIYDIAILNMAKMCGN